MMYYIYHIFGKKIGVTNSPAYRLRVRQGYNFNEYEIIEKSCDIDYVSSREKELQKEYDYEVDQEDYKQTIKNRKKRMDINPTEQTSTFPSPLNRLRGDLLDNLGYEWETVEGKFKITNESIEWIMQNANMSRFNAKC